MWSDIERRDLVETLREADPFAPTLCEGWQVRHLATHLYVRRHRPWKLNPKAWNPIAESIDSVSALRKLVDQFDAEVRPFSPLKLMDRTFGDLANLGEYVIHHEDVRRGHGPTTARDFPEPMAAAILSQCARFARLRLRRVRVAVVLEVPGGPSLVVRRGPDPVTATGSPADLALLVSGRARAAEVTWRGPSAPVRGAFGLD